MENEEVVVPETTEVVTPEVNENVETTTEETTGETVSELKLRLEKAEKKATDQELRAQRAEKKAKENKNVNSNSSTSTKDLVALMNAKVPEEDIGEVEEMAKFKGVSIAEVLRTDTVKAILALKAEQRNTAAATNVGNARRSGSKVTDESLLDSASKGNLPESDADIKRLLALKMKKK